MNRSNRLSRIGDRLELLHARLLTPAVKRAAWRECQLTGRLPDDLDLRDLCGKLHAVGREFEERHTVVALDGPED